MYPAQMLEVASDLHWPLANLHYDVHCLRRNPAVQTAAIMAMSTTKQV